MKNIQIIDGGDNCAYQVFQASDKAFALIFPGAGQDIEFSDDLFKRLGEKKAREVIGPLWKRAIEKRDAMGIHGTLFYQLGFKKKFYPNKRESDLDGPVRQRTAIRKVPAKAKV